MAGIGGIFAVSIIVVIAVGIGALTLLFVGSAVAALERFARVAKRWKSLLGCGLFWSGVVACGVLYVRTPELSARPWGEWLESWAIVSAQTARVTAALIVSIPLIGLRHIQPEPGGDFVINRSDDLGLDAVRLENTLRHTDQPFRVRHDRIAAQRAVDKEHAQVVILGRGDAAQMLVDLIQLFGHGLTSGVRVRACLITCPRVL